jgi:hypothetical protein
MVRLEPVDPAAPDVVPKVSFVMNAPHDYTDPNITTEPQVGSYNDTRWDSTRNWNNSGGYGAYGTTDNNDSDNFPFPMSAYPLRMINVALCTRGKASILSLLALPAAICPGLPPAPRISVTLYKTLVEILAAMFEHLEEEYKSRLAMQTVSLVKTFFESFDASFLEKPAERQYVASERRERERAREGSASERGKEGSASERGKGARASEGRERERAKGVRASEGSAMERRERDGTKGARASEGSARERSVREGRATGASLDLPSAEEVVWVGWAGVAVRWKRPGLGSRCAKEVLQLLLQISSGSCLGWARVRPN